MPVPLDERTRALLDGRNFPVVSTVRADGSPQSTVVWAKRDGDTLLFVALAGRGKAQNLARDPRISVSVFDTANPYVSAEIRGIAQLTAEDPKKLAAELAVKYLGDPEVPEDALARVVIRVVPDRILAFPKE